MIIYVRAKIDNQAENITAKRQERQEPTHPPGVSKDKNSKHCPCPDTWAKFPILPCRPYDEISIGKYP
jgi:hypothetical protein